MGSGKDGARRHHRFVVAACAALVFIGGGAVIWAGAQQVGTPPTPVVAEMPTDEAPPDEKATDETAAGDAAAPADAPENSTRQHTTPAPSSASETAAEVEPLPASRPVAVRIPRIGVDSPVHGLGLDAEGQLQVPSGERYDEVAWYNGSPTPGETGPAVLEGHVTGSRYAPSVFFELGATRAGDRIEVDRVDGTTAIFEVTDVKSAPKADFPRIDVYGATKGPELRVITCGGAFDEESGHHLDNVIVFAELVRG